MLLWQTSQTINFAQGEFVMLPAFFVLAAMKFGGLSFPMALLVGFGVALLVLGLLFKRLVVDPILRHGVLPLVISTLGLAIFFKEGVKEFYAAEAQGFPGVWPTTNVTIAGAVISAQSLVIIAVAVVAVGVLQYFLGGTRTGRQMQATAQNPMLARVLGIVDNLVAAYWSSQYRAAFPLFLLIAVILWRPQGLLGRAEERTV